MPDWLFRSVIFNFSDPDSDATMKWFEYSDTMIPNWESSSKGVLMKQDTQEFQRAIFFASVSVPKKTPRADLKGFAGVYKKTNFDLSLYSGFRVNVRQQGKFGFLKMVLFTDFEELKLELNPAQGPLSWELSKIPSPNNFGTVDYPMESFTMVNSAGGPTPKLALNQRQITGIGFKVEGVAIANALEGVGSFELESVIVYRNFSEVPDPKPDDDDKTVTLMDFTTVDTVADWYDNSDSEILKTGDSAATMDMLEATTSQNKRRAIFFGLLNPQPDNSGYAGVQKDVSWDLSAYSKLKVRMKAVGSFDHFKVYLYDEKKSNVAPEGVYKSGFITFFDMPSNQWVEKEFPFADFKQYVNNNQPVPILKLNPKDLRGISFVMHGGKDCAYAGQKGPTTLEIEWIKAVK
jgi:hypothetical protein